MFHLRLTIIGIILAISCAGGSQAAVINVPGDHSTIQAAINAASVGDQIVAAPGTYQENIDFGGKDVQLMSTDPDDSTVVAATIIDGASSDVVVKFSGAETSACLLSGFTITNGRSNDGGGIRSPYGANGTQATITNNIIENNWSEAPDEAMPRIMGIGGGILNCDGLIKGNVIRGNSAYAGGGLGQCDGTIEDNRIEDNWGDNGGGFYRCYGVIRENIINNNDSFSGGGFYLSEGTVVGNIVSNNTAHPGGYVGVPDAAGGGFMRCSGTIRNNLVYNNVAETGGAFYYCDANLANNTIYANEADEAMRYCTGTIKNCIIWNPSGVELSGSSTPSYSCVRNYSGGTGNINLDPKLKNPSGGDFHLLANSPCIDAGGAVAGLSDDYEGQSRPYDGTSESRGDGSNIDIGADEYYPGMSGAANWLYYR